jgi:hypothetical protein
VLGKFPGLQPSAGDAPPAGSDFGGPNNYTPWVNVVLGLLVFILRYSSPRGTFGVHWNLFLTGLVIMFAGLADTIAHDGRASKNYWPVIDLAAGVWLLISVKIVPSIPQVTIAQLVLGAAIVVGALVSLAIDFSQNRGGRQPTQ